MSIEEEHESTRIVSSFPSRSNVMSFQISRRTALSAGLAALASSWVARGGEPPGALLSPKPSMLPARAKSIIVLVTQGGMSQMDTFDPKPALDRLNGKRLTPDILPGLGEVRTFFGGKD